MMPGNVRLALAAAAIMAAGCASAASLSVNDPRPLAEALLQLSARAGQAITYEDPPYEYPGAVADVSRAVRGAGAVPGEPPLLVPRGGQFTFAVPDALQGKNVAGAVRAVVGRYNQSGGPATFTVVEDGRFIHVVPARARAADGRMQAVSPVLDATITVAAKPRSGLELLQEICRAASAASGRSVEVGMAPYDALARLDIAGGAEGESARDALEGLIEASGLRLSWRLLYDPGVKAYYLNLRVVG